MPIIPEVKSILKGLLSKKKDPFLIVPKTPKTRVAYIISRIFGPSPLVCLTFAFIALKSGIGIGKAIWVYPLIFTISVAIPLAIGTYLIMTKKVKDVEWSDIKDREKYLPPIVIFSLFTLTVLIWLLTSSTLFHLTLLFDAIALAMVLIYKYLNLKASMHIMFATITFASIVLFFGFQFIGTFLLILPIMWARRTLKVHSWTELMVGFFVPVIIMLVALMIFGWPNI